MRKTGVQNGLLTAVAGGGNAVGQNGRMWENAEQINVFIIEPVNPSRCLNYLYRKVFLLMIINQYE